MLDIVNAASTPFASVRLQEQLYEFVDDRKYQVRIERQVSGCEATRNMPTVSSLFQFIGH
jgi:hypothetical protein